MVSKHILSILQCSTIGRYSFWWKFNFTVEKSDKKIIDLIHEIEKHKKENGIDEWTISDTTLECIHECCCKLINFYSNKKYFFFLFFCFISL